MMTTFRTLATDAQVLKLVEIMETDRDRSWHSRDILDEYRRQYPNDAKKENRGAAIRNQLQRYCPTSLQYKKGYPPLFENPSKAHWRLTPEYQAYLATSHIPLAKAIDGTVTYAA